MQRDFNWMMNYMWSRESDHIKKCIRGILRKIISWQTTLTLIVHWHCYGNDSLHDHPRLPATPMVEGIDKEIEFMVVTLPTPKYHHNRCAAEVVVPFGSLWCHNHDRKRDINLRKINWRYCQAKCWELFPNCPCYLNRAIINIGSGDLIV